MSRSATIAIIGTGLIGTSVGLALRARASGRVNSTAPAPRILGWDPAARNAKAAKRLGAIDAISPTFDQAISNADVVVLAAPLGALTALVPRAIRGAQPGALVLDVGGLKTAVTRAASRALRMHARAAKFVAGHPMAGSERAGPSAASAELFEGRPFALFAPMQPKRASAWQAAEAFVRALGGLPVRIAPEEHDRIVAATSALPQLASVAIALAAERAAGRRRTWLAGPGFEGATRLAETPFPLWAAALTENRRDARRALRALQRELAAIDAALARPNTARLAAIFRSAAAARRRICKTGRRSRRTRSS